MSRVVLRNAWWITIAASLLSLLSLVGCSSVPPKLAPVNLPSTLPVRQKISAVKVSTSETKAAAEAERAEVDRAIVLAHQEAVAASDAERIQSQQALKVALEQVKVKADESATKAALSDQKAADAVAEAEALRKSQDEAATKALALQEQNEQYRQNEIGDHKLMGLGGILHWTKYFFAHAILWLAGFAAVLTALSFFVPAIGAFVTMVLTNLFKLFTKR